MRAISGAFRAMVVELAADVTEQVAHWWGAISQFPIPIKTPIGRKFPMVTWKLMATLMAAPKLVIKNVLGVVVLILVRRARARGL